MKVKLSKISTSIFILSLLFTSFIICTNTNEKKLVSVKCEMQEFVETPKSPVYSNLKEEITDETNCQYDSMNNGNIILTEYYGNKDCVIISKEISGRKIDKIYPEAFTINTNLEVIKIPINIAQNVDYIHGFDKNDELSDNEYIVYTTNKEYTTGYLVYTNLSEEEKSKFQIIPTKFVGEQEENSNNKFSSNLFSNNFNNSFFSAMPSKYDLRNYINVKVENQQNLGICYAYAINTSIQTYIALHYGENVDFSEIHLAMKSGQMAGGTTEGSYQYFNRGMGPVVEKANTILNQNYVETQRNNDRIAGIIWNACCNATTESTVTEAQKKEALQALDSISSNSGYYVMTYKQFTNLFGLDKNDSNYKNIVTENRNAMKDYIMHNGSIVSAILYDEQRYKDYGNVAVMCTEDPFKGLGHDVSIIGWDDNFSKSNFPKEWGVTQDGAWLVLNSWGNDWGNGDGTFWISYQDCRIESLNCGFADVCKEKVNINKADIDLYVMNQVYNENPITPIVKVTYNGVNCIKGQDYTVTYSNNINAGTATVTITGTGNYTGTAVKTFIIKPKDLNPSQIISTAQTMQYDGIEKKSTVVVRDGGKLLVEGTDYTITYRNNINVGKADIIITGIGNYTGVVTRDFMITAKNLSLDMITLSNTVYEYDGTEKRPEVVVKDGNKVLVEGIDYKLTYKNNINIGTGAAVVVEGIGAYKGTMTKGFVITARNLSLDMITLSNTVYEYDGTEKRPEVVVKDGNKVLVEGIDYKVTYKNNINIGTEAAVVVEGIGAYKGTMTKGFVITSKNFRIDMVTLGSTVYEYDGAEKRPEVIVKDGDRLLIEGIDYIVTYKNNINVGTEAVVIVEGMGAYKGTMTIGFAIIPKKLSTDMVTLDNTVYEYDGTEKRPNVEVKDGSKILIEGMDYTVTYKNNINAGTAVTTITGIGNYSESNDYSFQIAKANPSYMIPVGLVARYGTKLKDVKLPEGFKWEDDLDTMVGEPGFNTYKCSYTPEDTLNYNIINGIDVVIEVTEKLKINIENYKTKTAQDDSTKYITEIKVGDTIQKIKAGIVTNGTVELYTKDGVMVIDQTQIIKTGMKLKIQREEEEMEYTLIVSGDNNGDGKIDMIDVIRANLFVAKLKILQNEFLEAADINNDGDINLHDVIIANLVNAKLREI